MVALTFILAASAIRGALQKSHSWEVSAAAQTVVTARLKMKASHWSFSTSIRLTVPCALHQQHYKLELSLRTWAGLTFTFVKQNHTKQHLRISLFNYFKVFLIRRIMPTLKSTRSWIIIMKSEQGKKLCRFSNVQHFHHVKVLLHGQRGALLPSSGGLLYCSSISCSYHRVLQPDGKHQPPPWLPASHGWVSRAPCRLPGSEVSSLCRQKAASESDAAEAIKYCC